MTGVKEARQQAFRRWVEYDNKANELDDGVFKLELVMNKAYAGIKVDTEIYQSYEFFGQLWFDWYNEYFREVDNHVRSLGFKISYYPTTSLGFDATKSESSTYHDFWIREAINVDRFFVDTKSSSGVFHRFMMLEDAMVTFGVIDKLDENGYLELTALIDKCINYLDNVVSEKIPRYVELLKYMVEKRDNARRSCDEYIRIKMKENRQDSVRDGRELNVNNKRS